MTNRSTYEASVKSAAAARVLTNISNAITHQESVNSSSVNGGTSLARGVSAANDVLIRQANAAYIAAKQNAAMIEQVTIQNAKDLLRSTGDTGPA